jgi:hypothetical protein
MVINQNMPFASLGSGYHITNPFLSFIRKVFWPENDVPTLQVGIFSAVLALNLAIEINSGGINAPLHLAVIRKEGEGYVCCKLQEDEISQHQENAKEAMRHFGQYRHIFDTDNIEIAPAIPQLPQATPIAQLAEAEA